MSEARMTELKGNALIFCNKKDVDAFIKDIPNNSFYVHYYYLICNKTFNVLLHVILLELELDLKL